MAESNGLGPKLARNNTLKPLLEHTLIWVPTRCFLPYIIPIMLRYLDSKSENPMVFDKMLLIFVHVVHDLNNSMFYLTQKLKLTHLLCPKVQVKSAGLFLAVPSRCEHYNHS